MDTVGVSKDSATNADAWDLLGSSLVPDQHTNLITDFTNSRLSESSIQGACVINRGRSCGSIGFLAVCGSSTGCIEAHLRPLSANTEQGVGVGILREAEVTSCCGSCNAALALRES